VSWPNHSRRTVVGIAETSEVDPLGQRWSCAAFFPSSTGHRCLGFAWQNGVMHPLPTLGGNNGYAAGANNLGQIVGWAETAVHDPTCIAPQVLQFQAVIWEPRRGQIRQLPPLEGDPDSAATAINNRGQVVGISGTCYKAVGALSAKAFLWQRGVMKDLNTLVRKAPPFCSMPTTSMTRGKSWARRRIKRRVNLSHSLRSRTVIETKSERSQAGPRLNARCPFRPPASH
jgi:probable HAF family extracellular repeat protein